MILPVTPGGVALSVNQKSKIIGSGGAKGVADITQFTFKALNYAAQFGEGVSLKVRYDANSPFKLTFGDGKISSLTVVSWGLVNERLIFFYVDETRPWDEQVLCLGALATIIRLYLVGSVVMSPDPNMAGAIAREFRSSSNSLACLLAGNLISKGKDPLEIVGHIEGLDAIAFYGHEFTPDMTKKLQGLGYYVIYNVRNSTDENLIREIAKTGAWIICYDPRGVAGIIQSQ